jgi:hypothetical protein
METTSPSIGAVKDRETKRSGNNTERVVKEENRIGSFVLFPASSTEEDKRNASPYNKPESIKRPVPTDRPAKESIFNECPVRLRTDRVKKIEKGILNDTRKDRTAFLRNRRVRADTRKTPQRRAWRRS